MRFFTVPPTSDAYTVTARVTCKRCGAVDARLWNGGGVVHSSGVVRMRMEECSVSRDRLTGAAVVPRRPRYRLALAKMPGAYLSLLRAKHTKALRQSNIIQVCRKKGQA